ncbi:class I mannose-6-phosphate isomerase [Aporhodopirellula aestuarii]|uniref:Class I mannose-6-phosphate isomerase n=1 Tax=Aporhodopirellula aestuarii TaxID=2950107 RepID=A0ABT0TYD8_9BACT|nr:class I mannose-6-phosphate isomerase [Aporhodopirellula aestuarii]MCM2369607.1 class I mannose-6-phosphate isomerase [Aporhodopirellula aestuarii]
MKNLPLQLTPNYAWRSYLGGSRLREFRKEAAGDDDHFPEDWLASTSRARNGEHQQREDEGVSHVTVDGNDIALTDLITSEPAWFWGNQTPPVDEPGQIGVLIKLLDAGVRLHLQAHPNREFVKQRFGGNAGKTECWYILSVRDENAYVYLGFQHPPTQQAWAKMVREQDLEGMRGCFEKIPVKPGDCLMVPSGTPHAIGEGIFMIELQEPTDWVVRCEFSAGGHVLEHNARFMGLELDDVLSMFDYREHPLASLEESLIQRPHVIRTTDAFTEERVIDSRHQDFFRLRRFTGSGAADWVGGEPMVLIALAGSGTLNDAAISAGETWLLPGASEQWDWRPSTCKPGNAASSATEKWSLLLAQPPLRPTP